MNEHYQLRIKYEIYTSRDMTKSLMTFLEKKGYTPKEFITGNSVDVLVIASDHEQGELQTDLNEFEARKN